MQWTSKPTLSDVAARAGVSATTASYILNGRTAQMRISADTEGRVRRGRRRARATGPTAAPAACARRRPRPSAWSPTSSPAATSRATCSPGPTPPPASSTTCWSSARPRAVATCEEQFIEEMLDRQVDGIIYATLAARAVSAPSALRGQRAVLLNCIDRDADLPAVMPDDVMGGRVAAEALLAAGCTDGIYVVGEDPLRRRRRRSRAARGRARGAPGGGRPAGGRGGVRVGGHRVVRRRVGVARRPHRAPGPDLPQRPHRDGGLPGAGRPRPGHPRRRRGRLLRRLRARRLAAPDALVGGPAVRGDGSQAVRMLHRRVLPRTSSRCGCRWCSNRAARCQTRPVRAQTQG